MVTSILPLYLSPFHSFSLSPSQISHSSNARHCLRAVDVFVSLFRSFISVQRRLEIEAGEPVSFNFYSSSASAFERLAAAGMAQQLHMLIRWLRGKCLEVLGQQWDWSVKSEVHSSMPWISRPQYWVWILLSEPVSRSLHTVFCSFTFFLGFASSVWTYTVNKLWHFLNLIPLGNNRYTTASQNKYTKYTVELSSK